MSEITDSLYSPKRKEFQIAFDKGHVLVFENVPQGIIDNYQISFDKKSFIARHLKPCYKFYIRNKQYSTSKA